MIKKLMIIWSVFLVVACILLGWQLFMSGNTDVEQKLPEGVIREDSLNIETDNPQPAGRNIQPGN